MSRMTGLFARLGRVNGRAAEVVGLALLAYVPFLFSSPGMVSADTKQYLYLDPGRFLARAAYAWDPHVATGTVPHQHLGYLFPMGPYYWLMDRVGVPDWIAQRIWLGTISLAAALGARWLFAMLGTRRLGALAGALVYMLTPYQLAFTARMSVLLLPWAALPWLVGLTMRAVRHGGWRDPALIALITLTAGSVNASALILVGVAPALWVVLELFRGRAAARAAIAATARVAVLAVGVSAWWAVGLRLQGAYGLPVLQLTENVQTVSVASWPNDVLRGIGNWFFYGRDRLGYSIDQAADYVSRRPVVLFSYAVPAAALIAAFVVRWRHRAYFAILVVAGTVVAVGAWPYDDPSPYGRVWRDVAEKWSPALALRNTPRVVPIVVLGLAALIAAAVGAVTSRKLEVMTCVAVGAVAMAALTPVWRTGYFSDGIDREGSIPAYWTEAAAALDREGNATRVLEIPGANFAAYRWGNTVEPVTPGLIDRPYVAREVLPYGTPHSADLLDALDRRIQQGTFEASSLAPVARLLGVGTVVLRSDLEYERHRSPRPRLLWAQLTEPAAPGLAAPTGYGSPDRNAPPPDRRLVDELELRTPVGAADPPPVAVFEVDDPVQIVHVAPASRPVVLVGDGDGIVDAAAAGLLDGDGLVLQLASLDDAALRDALDAGADLVLTDSNRRRFRNFFSSIRDTTSQTERAGQETTDPNGYEMRLEVFPGSTDSSRTVVEQVGGRVDATGDGGAERPEDRAARAFDRDVRTSWRVGGADPTVHTLTLHADEPVRADQLTLVQPLDGARDRVLTRVRLRFDEGDPLTVELGPDSLTPAGQVVRFAARDVRRLDVDLLATTRPPFDPFFANAVGFAEVQLGDVRVSETVRLPVDLEERIGGATRGHRLDVVLSRLRFEPGDRDREDDELTLDRRFVLPDDRTFGFSGTVRINPNADDSLLDSVLGTIGSGATYSASGHLAGDLDARASRAFDGDPATAWTAAFGLQDSQWLEVGLAAPVTVDRLDLTVVADGRHSVPTRLRLESDGAPSRLLSVPEITDAEREGASSAVTLPFEAVSARRLRLVVEEVRPAAPVGGGRVDAGLPVAFAEVGVEGAPRPAAPRKFSDECRDDLVEFDGRPLLVRIEGSVAQARSGLALESCEDSLTLDAGSHWLRSRAGLDTAIDIDRVVLASDATGNAAPVDRRGTSLGTAGATVEAAGDGATALDVTVRTDGKPFWLVLGQSASDGWKATTSDGSLGEREVVDGYANGWLVHPSGPGTMTIALEWTPQRFVWVGLVVSAFAVLACIGIVMRTRSPVRRARVLDASVPQVSILGADPVLVSPLAYEAGPTPSWLSTAALAALIAVGTAAVSRPWIALVAGSAVVATARVRVTRGALALMVPLLLGVSRLVDRPEIAWVALAGLAVDVAVGHLRERSRLL